MGKVKDTYREARERVDSDIAMGKMELDDLYKNPMSTLHCVDCKSRMSLLRFICKALGKSQGAEYRIKCRKCGTMNVRFKGMYRREREP